MFPIFEDERLWNIKFGDMWYELGIRVAFEQNQLSFGLADYLLAMFFSGVYEHEFISEELAGYDYDQRRS